MLQVSYFSSHKLQNTPYILSEIKTRYFIQDLVHLKDSAVAISENK